MTPIEELNKAIGKLIEIKKRAEDSYSYFTNIIKNMNVGNDDLERQSARMLINTIGKILGYPDKKITEDINKVLKGTGEEK